MKLAPVTFIAVALLMSLSSCGLKKQKDKITPEVQAFQRPKDATVRLEGQQFPYCVWFDPNKWIILDTPFDRSKDISEWTLVLVDLEDQVSIGKDIEKKAFAKSYTYEEKNISRAAYKEFVQSKVLGQDKESLMTFKDLGSEERLVSGIKIFAWRFMVEYQNVGSITTFLYFYSDNDGSVAITTFTPSEDWKKNASAMEGLLNGFCLLQSSQ